MGRQKSPWESTLCWLQRQQQQSERSLLTKRVNRSWERMRRNSSVIQRIRTAHCGADNMEQQTSGTHEPPTRLWDKSTQRTWSKRLQLHFCIVQKLLPEGKPCMSDYNLCNLYKGDLSFLPFKSRMTVHSDSLGSPVLMPLSRLPWPDLHPGTRAQSRVVRMDPRWQSLAWRPGLLTPHAPSTPTVNPRNPMLQGCPSSQMSCYPPNTIKTPPKLYFISTHLSLLEGAERSFFFFFFLKFLLVNTV